MERHLCSRSECELGSDYAKELSEHKLLPTEGSKTKDMTGSHHLKMSDCPKRKLRSCAGEEHMEKSEEDGRGNKRVRKGLEQGRTPTEDSAPPKSKEYVTEGAEHIYRTHTCPTCRRCFKMRSHLQEHLHLHFPDPSLQCPGCKRHFTSKSKLRVHRLREAGEKIHRCHLCEYSAVERNAIRRHVASMHADEAQDGVKTQSYPCPACGESFHQSRSLKAHMKAHNAQTAGEPVSCFQAACPFQSSLRKELLRHTDEVHGIKAVECRHRACAAIFPTETLMESHYQTHLPYHCSLCRFSSSNKTLYLQHQRLGHAGADELRCDFCSFATFNSVEFGQHVGRLHAHEKIHRCSQCSYVTSHKRGLKRHVLMHSGEKPHKCTLCDYRCRDESYLSRHMLTHSTDKNFMCAECGYITKWKHYLNVHMRKHAGDLRHQCDQCPYRCHRTDQLNSHKLRHQAKSLMCEICGYACKRKYELRNHMLAKHADQERQSSVHKCKYCAYTTCYRQALQNHENCKHTKRREFRCALCPYTSFSGISLFLHKRKAHGYVPGDKAWLENYAAKEREMNSTDSTEGFYSKRSAAGGQTDEPTASQREESLRLGAIGALDDVAQEVVAAGVSDRVNSPEEYCTLILTTLSTSDYQTPTSQHTGENCANPTASCDSTRERSDSSTPANSLVGHSVAEHRQDGEQSDVDDSYEPLNTSTSRVEEPSKSPSPEPNPKMNRSILSNVHSHRPSDREVRLEAMKKHDRDQGEAMVLEGRVQMVVVPAKDDPTFVATEEAGLKHRSEAGTLGGTKDFKCNACGAQFKQRRSLRSHMTKKKCPALPRTTRTSVGNPKMCPTEEESCPNSAQSELPPQNTVSIADRQQREEVTPSEGCDDEVPSSTECQQSKTPLYIKTGGKLKCKLCNFTSVRLATVERHVGSCQKKLGKEVDDQCDSESVAQTEDTLDQHHAAKDRDQKAALVKSHRSRRTKPKEHTASKKGKTKLSHCQLCTFTCPQKRCLAQHVALKHKDVQPQRFQHCPVATARHKSRHAGTGRHECDVCDRSLGSATKLRQHKSRVHGKKPTHFCSVCDFSGYTPDDVRRHGVRCHTGELRHACGECEACFSSERARRNHRKRAHALQTQLPCKQCDYTCSSERSLEAHQQRRHRLVECTICHTTFLTKENLETHQRSHLAHRCQLCTFAAKTKRLLAQHLASEHEQGSAEEKPLRCSSCEFACRHQLVLEQHLRSHGGRRLYKCADCEYSTRNKQKITWHIRIHTGEKPYSCERCSYACTDPSRLKLHMRVHQEERKYLCPECGYKCKWATQLKYHMTKHTGEKPYACDECDYRTNRADALRAHRDTRHCDTRPYVCEKCGKAFKTSFILKTHQRQHSDERPYTCGLCQKTFRWPAGLRHHYLSHTKQQPFHCRHCSYTAKQRFQVVKHLHRHHPEVSAEEGVVKDSGAAGLRLREALQGMLDERAAEPEEEGIATGGEDAASEESLRSEMKRRRTFL